MPHIIYKHGDKYRLYTPTMVVTTGPRESISANLMYIPYTSTTWSVMYIVHDGPYYFSGSNMIRTEDGYMPVGDGHIKSCADTFIVDGTADPEDLTILLMDQKELYKYMTENAITTPHVIMSPCGVTSIVAPGFFVSSTKEIDIKDCPVSLQPLYLGFETFEKAAERVAKTAIIRL